MPNQIPSYSTVASVWPHLTNQRDYVSGVLRFMKKCEKSHHAAFVRIGVTGTGQKPYYRIFYDVADPNHTIFGSYYDNHTPLEVPTALTSNWSSTFMTVQEVETFLAEKVGWTGSRR